MQRMNWFVCVCVSLYTSIYGGFVERDSNNQANCCVSLDHIDDPFQFDPTTTTAKNESKKMANTKIKHKHNTRKKWK